METALGLGFRFVAYVLFGLTMETLFAIDGIERALGCPVHRRVPKKYLEGFVSAYMIPLHGLGLLFGFEPMAALVSSWPWPLRFGVYAAGISAAEAAWGFVLDRTLGFYTWDYYADSRFRVFKRGYTLWTLVPLWGMTGLVLEGYSGLLIHLTPQAVAYFLG